MSLRPQQRFRPTLSLVQQQTPAPSSPAVHSTASSDSNVYYDSDQDPTSEKGLMNVACDVWWEQWLKGQCNLTPPYVSMKNWKRRLGLEEEGEEEHDEVNEAAIEDVGSDVADYE